jgi:diguanylate cyclase (GGDEF)-like protein
MITSFCRQTGLTIENNRQHQELYRKFDRLAAVATLTEPILPLDNEKGLLQSILERSAELLLAEQGSLMLLDQETDALFLKATKGTVERTGEKIWVQKGVGIAGKVAELGEPLLVANIEEDPRIGQKSRSRYKTSSFVSVPLKIEERIIGVLNLTDKTTGGVFDEEDLQLAQAFASRAAVVLERRELSEQMDRLKKLSITDHLTGLLNRRYLHDRLEEELARSQRFNRQLSVLMVDLDGFKQYNDTFGHLAGDRILEAIAVVIMNSVRSIDIVARYGGDEFTIILPETGISMAILIGERLRSDIAQTALPVTPQGTSEHTITASIGIACFPEHDTTANSLIDAADTALYRAKTAGKNRIEVFA